MGVLDGNPEKTPPKRYQDLLLWVWLEIVFTPKWHQFYHNPLTDLTSKIYFQIFPVIFFFSLINTLNVIGKVLAVDF